MRLGIKLIFGLAIASAPVLTPAQMADVRSFGFFEGQEQAVEIAELPSGGYILAGTTNANDQWNTDAFVYALNDDLSVAWLSMLGDPGLNQANGIAILNDGIAVLTTILSYDNAYQLRLYKLSLDGELLFTRDLGTSDWDFGIRVRAGNDGSLFVLAESYADQDSGIQTLVYKLDANGETLWEQWLGDVSDDRAADMAITADNSLYVLATRMESGQGGQFQYWKLDTDGNTEWAFDAALPGTYVARALCLSETGFAATGHEVTDQGNDKFILGVDDSGSLLWDRHYPLEGNQSLGGIAFTGDGFALAGESDTFGAGGWGVYVMKSDINGWWSGAAVFGGAEDEKAYSVIVDASSRILFAGETDSYGDGTRNAYLVRLPSSSVQAEYTLNLGILEEDSFTGIEENENYPNRITFFDSQVALLFQEYPFLRQGSVLCNAQGALVAAISGVQDLEQTMLAQPSGMFFLIPNAPHREAVLRIIKP